MAIHVALRRTAATITNSSTSPTKPTTFICSQCRHATLLRRPKRPYTFTQLITLSDGSTFLHRTTSPVPMYRATRDTRNSLLWNPSSSKLMNIEEDEAGRLAAFRARFGRSWDANSSSADVDVDADAASENRAEQDAASEQAQAEQEEEDDNLLDLISSFGQEEAPPSESKKKK